MKYLCLQLLSSERYFPKFTDKKRLYHLIMMITKCIIKVFW